MHRNVAVVRMGEKRHMLMIPCASRCTQECRNRGDKTRVMRQGLGQAVETTMQREKETTKLEPTSIRVGHASEGQGWREAMSILGLCSVLSFAYSRVFKRKTSSGRD